jgi:predicted RNA-binding Zn-ribbon protein involved in translation (DUF1610 family)
MRAEIARVRLDIDYKCPNCYFHFRLSGNAIPRKKEKKSRCPECSELLIVPPVSIKANQTTSFINNLPKNNLPTKNDDDPIKERAKAAIRSQGYTSSEATQLINNAYYQGIPLVDLIKDAIKNDKRTTTDTT